jgi:MEMO1 family protein
MDKDRLRKPAVAGQFYPATSDLINKEIASFLPDSPVKKEAIGCMLPHAGYKYSGMVAVQTVSQVIIKDTVVLLGPNHTGKGSAFSLMSSGAWQTPSGDLSIDEELAQAILAGSNYLEDDDQAHYREHSLEVELPILQYFRENFRIVPIAFGVDDPDALKAIGKAIALGIKGLRRESSVLLVASSDMTHYESAASARKKDEIAIQAVVNLDAKALWNAIHSLSITMCGYLPVIAMINAARELGAVKGELVKYSTSGDVTGDNSSVVGYAGIVISK